MLVQELFLRVPRITSVPAGEQLDFDRTPAVSHWSGAASGAPAGEQDGPERCSQLPGSGPGRSCQFFLPASLVAGQCSGSPFAVLVAQSMANLPTLQGSKVDLQGARSTSSSLGGSPAMRLGVGVHPMGPARSVDLVSRGEYHCILACLDLAWLAAARCLPKASMPHLWTGRRFTWTQSFGMPCLAT